MIKNDNMKYIIANWKMHGDKDLCNSFLSKFDTVEFNYNVVLCPPYHLLDYMFLHNHNSNVFIGAQDCSGSLDSQGSRTGEISTFMLKSVGCGYIILGHSERRKFNNENNNDILNKMKSALKQSLKVILCIGEPIYNEDFNSFKAQILDQLSILQDVSSDILIAYEPVWAIGTGLIPTLDRISQVHQYIYNTCVQKFAIKPKILYGGSVNAENAKEILSLANVDGVLVGSASLNINTFFTICHT